jgi:hypothetical protein
MANLGYRILPLWTKELIGDALEDMERAGTHARAGMAGNKILNGRETNQACMSSGKAVWTAEKQLTPTETPISENTPGTKDVLPETELAFSSEPQQNTKEFVFQNRTVAESFPAYTEPIFE